MILSPEVVTQPVSLILTVLAASVISSLAAAYVVERLTHKRFQREIKEYEANVKARDQALGDHLKVAFNLISGCKLLMQEDHIEPFQKALVHVHYVIKELSGDTPDADRPQPGQGVPGF